MDRQEQTDDRQKGTNIQKKTDQWLNHTTKYRLFVCARGCDCACVRGEREGGRGACVYQHGDQGKRAGGMQMLVKDVEGSMRGTVTGKFEKR